MKIVPILKQYLSRAYSVVKEKLDSFVGWYHMVPMKDQHSWPGVRHDAAVVCVSLVFGFCVFVMFGSVLAMLP